MGQKANVFLQNIIIVSFGTVLIATGLCLLLMKEKIFDHLTDTLLEFGPESALYQSWTGKPNTPKIDLYFFNWTNPHEIHNFSVKPKFQDVGPYRYNFEAKIVKTVWNSNGTITYKVYTVCHFDKEKSKGNLSDKITFLNPLATTAAYMGRNWNYFIKKGLSVSLDSVVSSLHLTKTARELTFEGYEDPILNIKNSFQFMFESGLPYSAKFSWFGIRNNSDWYDGYLNMDTTRENFGKLRNWNYRNTTGFFEGHCTDVKGSSGQFHRRPIRKTKLDIFTSNLCSYATLDFAEEVYFNGILGYKFALGKNTFDNGTDNPDNTCFNVGEGIPSGVRNISECRFGSPTFASLPHFYLADRYYSDAIEGMRPKTLHQGYIILEPHTGLPLHGNMALQYNMLLQPVHHISLYSNVPKAYFPVFWFRQTSQVPDEALTKLYLFLKVPLVFIITGCILIGLGILLIAFVASKRYLCKRKKVGKIHFSCAEEQPLRTTKFTR